MNVGNQYMKKSHAGKEVFLIARAQFHHVSMGHFS
jgi:hypothetical protein